MDSTQRRFRVGALIFSLSTAAFLTGCATTDSQKESQPKAEKEFTAPNVQPLPAGVTLHKEKDLIGVWLAPGFSFAGQPALKIDPTLYIAIERKNEGEMRKFAVKELREKIADSARDSGVFSAVTTDDSSPAATNVLRLVNTIIEYEKGGGGARYFAGVYGAGQPVLRVRGLMYDSNTNLVFVYEAKRSGETGSARVFGAYRSDEDIQREDIKDLAIDLVAFFKRSAGIPEKKK